MTEYAVPLPHLDVQKEIVAEVEWYQKIIDGARQVVDNYKPRIQIDPEWTMVELGGVCNLISGFRLRATIWQTKLLTTKFLL